MFHLNVLGGASLEGPDGPLTGRATQRHRLALLTLLAASPRGLTRDKLIGYLWPERSDGRARHALSDSVYRVNQALGDDTVEAAGDELRLGADRLPSDLAAFRSALEREDWERAIGLYDGPFLDGFHLSGSSAFERWVDGERGRLARQYADALESLAEKRAAADDVTGAVEAWRLRAVHDRYDSRVAVRLMQALEAAGNRAGALRVARIHTRLLDQEFGTEPPSEVRALAERLRNEPEASSGIEPADGEPEPTDADPGPMEDDFGPAETPRPPPDDPVAGAGSEPVQRPGARATRPERDSPGNGPVGIHRVLSGVLILLVAAAGTWLAWRSAAGTSTPPSSIAVLPFDDLSPDERNRYFADGMTDDILTSLSRIGELRVIARSSVLPYRTSNEPVRVIARELGVGFVLEGSVRRSGDQVRITAHLVDARSNAQVWSDSYDRRIEDLFAVQREIAREIADALEAELTPAVEERIGRVPTDDLAAYELFLQGREHVRRHTREANQTGIGFLRRAIDRDPDFALARATLASAYVRGVWNYGGSARWADSATLEAERALALAPDLAEAHAALAGSRMAAGRYRAAASSYRRAIELSPSDWSAVNGLGITCFLTGRTARALDLWSRAAKGDPVNVPVYRSNLAEGFQQIGLLDRAGNEARSVLSVAPNLPYAVRNEALIGLLRGDTATALQAAGRLASDDRPEARALLSAGMLFLLSGVEDTRALEPLERSYSMSATAENRKFYTPVLLGYTLWQLGDRERAERVFREFQRFAHERIEDGNEYYLLRYSLAQIHAVRGESEEALRWLERGVEAGWVEAGITVRDPLLASIRDEPRYRTLVSRMRERSEELRRRVIEGES